MVTLVGLVRTIVVASKPFDCLPYQGRKTVAFKNGWKLDLTFPQFRDVRDSYSTLRRFQIKQMDSDLFEGNFGTFEIVGNLKIMCGFADLMHLYTITKLNEDCFKIKDEKLELQGKASMVGMFRELVYGEYKTNYKDKVVLDIGGFQGESAVYFWSLGAKKVVIYEPIEDYCRILKDNIAINGIDAEIHQTGIGTEDANETIDVFDASRLEGETPKKQNIKIRNIIDVITQSAADIAKIDCEGAEICLTTLPNEILRKIPLYMIELHGRDVIKAVTSKFADAGYKVVKNVNKSPDLAVVVFKA